MWLTEGSREKQHFTAKPKAKHRKHCENEI